MSLLIEQIILMTGNWYVHLLVILTLFDIVTGYVKAYVRCELDSTKARTGVVKHALVTVMILTLYPYMYLIGLSFYAQTFLIGYVIAMAVSVLENLELMGINLPPFVKDKLLKIRDSKGKGE